MGRLVINGDEIYELDEECMREKYEKRKKERREHPAGEHAPKPDRMPNAKNRAMR